MKLTTTCARNNDDSLYLFEILSLSVVITYLQKGETGTISTDAQLQYAAKASINVQEMYSRPLDTQLGMSFIINAKLQHPLSCRVLSKNNDA